jgi:DNA topoisomerase-3
MPAAKTPGRADAERDDVEQSLPPLDDGELADIVSIDVRARKTRAPAHYTEGTLLDDMKGASKFVEDDPELKKLLKQVSGLGTAATRDNIIENLKAHKYLEKSGKYTVATEKGIAFITWLEKVYPDAADVGVTARWEAELAVVEKKGGGKAFEDRVVQKVRDMISTFKAAPPMSPAATTTHKESHNMTDTNEQKRASKPTDKMLEFAKSIAKKVGVRLPDEVMGDFDACRAFIDEHKDVAMRPSDKQLNFANSIASSKGLTIPAEVMNNGRELSKWIDEHK